MGNGIRHTFTFNIPKFRTEKTESTAEEPDS